MDTKLHTKLKSTEYSTCFKKYDAHDLRNLSCASGNDQWSHTPEEKYSGLRNSGSHGHIRQLRNHDYSAEQVIDSTVGQPAKSTFKLLMSRFHDISNAPLVPDLSDFTQQCHSALSFSKVAK